VSHPVVFVYLIYPIMFIIVFTFSSLKEQWWIAIPHSKWLKSPIDVFVDFIVFACGASMAFCLTLAEFELLNETSAMSMMFIGVLKDIVNIVCGMLLFGDKFGTANVMGLGLCMLGVVGYNKYKWEQLKLKTLMSQRRGGDADGVPLVEITAISSTSPRRRSNDFTIA
jgi:solute carrier family 35 protein C2